MPNQRDPVPLPPVKTPTAPGKWRLLDRGARLALTVLIAWMAWWTFRSFSVMFIGVDPPARVNVEDGVWGPVGALGTMLSDPPPEAPWTFDGGAWAFSAVDVVASDLVDRLAAFERDSAAALDEADLARRPPLSLADRLDVLGTGTAVASPLRGAVRWSDLAGCRVYRHDGPRARLRVATRRTVQAGEHFLGGAFALAIDPAAGRWRLWEMLPQKGPVTDVDPAGSSSGVPSLLPLPHTARCLARRWSNDGRLWLEVVDAPGAARLPRQWTDGGWALLPSNDPHRYLCRRGDDLILAWTPTPLDTLPPEAPALWIFTRAPGAHIRGLTTGAPSVPPSR